MSKTTVGIRELKTNLSQYVRDVKAGASFVITEHGQPVGQLLPLGRTVTERVRDLAGSGFLEWNGQKLGDIEAPLLNRKQMTVAELLLEDRD